MEKKSNKGILKLFKSLSGKIIIVIVAFMILCVSLWTTVMFINMSGNAIDNEMTNEKAYMKSIKNNVKNVEEVCSLAMQAVSNMDSINEYIQLVKSGKDLSTDEKIDFYNNDIASIENMTNINPYLSRIRIYANTAITEKHPCFYKINRLENMSWGKNYIDGAWQVEYYDTIFPDSVNTNEHLAGIVKDINDANGNKLGVLEVATSMSKLFPNLYTNTKNEWSCFLSDDGNIYSCNNELGSGRKKELTEYINKTKDIFTYENFVIDGEHIIVSTMKNPALKGTYVHVISISENISSYYSSQFLYILVVIISMICFIILVVYTVTKIFKRFNKLSASFKDIEDNMEIRVPEDGDDEVAELGSQINHMLEHIEKLNKEETNRKLIIKNTEIKSLQNQINAHFMYNVLESIKMMAEIKEDYGISDAITSLGQMFRYSMKWTSGMVELKEEIAYIDNYLKLLNLRFDYEIYLSLNIPQKFMNLKIPKISLQPLVENSVYHGIEEMAENTSIYIKVFEKDGIINLEVSDAGRGMDEDTLDELNNKLHSQTQIDDSVEHGRALYNLQQRIKMYFGNEYGLEVFSRFGMYTKVLIKIPDIKEK